MDDGRLATVSRALARRVTRRGTLGLVTVLTTLSGGSAAARGRNQRRKKRASRHQKAKVDSAKVDTVRICRFTGSTSTPYQVLAVAPKAVRSGDLATNAQDGCCLDSDCTAFASSYCDEGAAGGAQCACDATAAPSIPNEECVTDREPCPPAQCGLGSNVAFGHSTRCCNQAQENCFKQAFDLGDIRSFCLPAGA